MRRSPHTARSMGAMVLFLVGGASIALADDKPVNVEVKTILATKDHDRVDPKLARLAEELKKTFRFTGFELRGQASKSSPIGKAAAFSLPDPYKLEVTPVERKNGAVSLEIAIFEKKGKEWKQKLKTKVTISKGKDQLLGGLPTQGGQLVLAISGS